MADLRLMEDWASLNDVLIPFLVRCGVAALCGAIVGLERELKRKPAGFRTNMLICVGSAMYMTVGLLLLKDLGSVTDPTRIASQVVTGIGFLGAGSILKSGQHVTGLTTAATIWVVAAIGIIAGAGFPVLALVASCLTVVTLIALGRFENRYLDHDQLREAEGSEERFE
jgi:putative Mg2+ transporter-C (MgtC) family protein